MKINKKIYLIIGIILGLIVKRIAGNFLIALGVLFLVIAIFQLINYVITSNRECKK